jgi:hypothetical protein
VVPERHLNVVPATTVVEADGAGVADVGAADAAPGDALVGNVLGDLGIPVTFQWLVVGPVTVTSWTSGMKAGKWEKSRQ